MKQATSPKRPATYPRFKYRANPLWPHERVDGIGELVQDAISGFWFPAVFGVEGPFGIVDGRNGSVLDLDVPEHEMAVTMIGQIPSRILPNG